MLRLRLRIEELEHELSQARSAQAAARSELDAVSRSAIWRASARAARLARRARPDVLAAASRGRVAPGIVRVPLAGMPADTGSSGARWADEIEIDGVALPGLFADPPARSSYRLVPHGQLRFRTFVGVRTGEALGNIGGVRFVVTVVDAQGHEVCRTERVVDPAGFPDQRRWLPLKLDLAGLPESEHRLLLSTELPEGANAEWAWAVWGDPVLLLGSAGSAGAARVARTLLTGADPVAPKASVASPVAPHPVISFLVPVHDPVPAHLERTIASVRAQTSPHWQLCLSDDGSTDPAVRALVETAAAGDPRIVVTRTETAAGISAATNAALALATGDFVAPLDHDDTLSHQAVAAVGVRLRADPALDVLYTDNDKELFDGARFAASLKPDWSPEYMRACMYTLHLGVYRRTLVAGLGGWRPEFDGAQDHDMVLRLADAGARFAHVPSVLYHWGVHPGSAAQGALAKPEAYERGRAAVEDHVRRTEIEARVEALAVPGRFRVVHAANPARRVDLVMPLTDDLAGADVGRWLTDIARPELKVTLVPGQRAASALTGADDRANVLPPVSGSWSDLASAGVAATSAPVVVICEDLCVPETDDWLDELSGLVSEPHLGAAGALVVDGQGLAVHAGVALPLGVPLPVHPGADPEADDAPPELTMVTNRSAVSGVVALDRERLLRAGGLAAGMDRLSLVATTLAIGASGARVAISPHARLRLMDGPPRAAVLSVAELARIAARRGQQPDPFYNPNLWADRAAHVVPLSFQREGFADEGEA